ncbi:adenylosuccinate lyase [Candidatus Micrarchaeota archaeon CG10_big_fil_rev_8_21_14_0_10_45_29]|nr:MAG: adenylosuccinate lyase [Candidatus Micrarchaeota archaeon CG10_big_fil_rev_8_21_14_0_10_45_29]
MSISPIEQRYATEMNSLFEEKAKLDGWMRVEVALARAHAKLGHIPKNSADEIEAAASKVQLSRVLEIENEIHHDLMAMVRALSENCGESGKFVHLGATSYDIEDTALALTMRDAGGLLRSRIIGLQEILGRLAKEKKSLVCVGRTHGQHAVPTTYGMKFALIYEALERQVALLDNAIRQISAGKMSGAVGTMATFGKDAFKLQEIVMEELGLESAPITTQVIGRERHAQMLFVIASIASILDKLAKDIRNLSRNEILEVAEGFAKKQVGSSTMPQKRNPHKCERICSLARLVRANCSVALENIPLEHERDLTNSANERFIIPQSFILCDYMLKQTSLVLESLEFFEANIKKNLEMGGGAILAERAMMALAEKGMGRQEAHELVRTIAKEAAKEGKPLKEALAQNKKASDLLDEKELEKIFDYSTYTGKAEEIVKKIIK